MLRPDPLIYLLTCYNWLGNEAEFGGNGSNIWQQEILLKSEMATVNSGWPTLLPGAWLFLTDVLVWQKAPWSVWESHADIWALVWPYSSYRNFSIWISSLIFCLFILFRTAKLGELMGKCAVEWVIVDMLGISRSSLYWVLPNPCGDFTSDFLLNTTKRRHWMGGKSVISEYLSLYILHMDCDF